jgi:hypothetical protein
VEIAVEKMAPEIIGLPSSQKIHGKIALKAAEIDDRAHFLHAIQGLRPLAKRAGIDPANLARVLNVRLKVSRLMLIKGPRESTSRKAEIGSR